MFAASPISTGLFKRFGHRKVAIVGVLLCSAGLLLSAAVPNPYYLFATYSLLFGVGSNFIDNTSLNLIGTYFPRKNSARASCFATLGWSIGSLALNPAVEILCEKFGWRKTFIILGCCLLVHGLVCAALFRKKIDYVEIEISEEEDSENREEYYNDDEINTGDDVFKAQQTNGYIPVKGNFQIGEPVLLSTQLSTIEESALSNENINQNCHTGTAPVQRKESVSFAPTTQLPSDGEEGLPRNDSNVSQMSSNGSRKDSRSNSRGRQGSSNSGKNDQNGRKESSISRKDSTGKMRRNSSMSSRRDSIVSFIRRDSTWSRRDSTRSRRIPIPDNTPKHTTKQYIKAFLHTMKAPGILLWGAANILMNMSLIFPFVNFIKYMETIGIPSAKGVHVLMVFGLSDMVGRGSSAMFGDYIPFHTVYVYPICNLIMGAVTMCLLVIDTIPGLYGYAIVVGTLTGIVNSMLLKVSMDLFGHKLLAEAWTLTLLAAGIGITFGPSIAGASYDLTQSFDVAFYIGGGIYLLAAVVTLAIPFVQRWKKWVPEKKSKPGLDALPEDALPENLRRLSIKPLEDSMAKAEQQKQQTEELEKSAKRLEERLTIV
ncbi:uncharacterized protein LOC129265327 [Lytechinus pictus]|uniref:uncharacterized protein LOC129265327 n=1 Tax=Lytechinus pictus TaxID=7653 RepID=UPI0030BA0E3E